MNMEESLSTTPAGMQNLLKEYVELFQEPTQLPLHVILTTASHLKRESSLSMLGRIATLTSKYIRC